LFVDDYLIERLRGASLRLHPPSPREVVMTFDRPWEGAFSFYTTVINDGDRFRLYYRGWPDAANNHGGCYCYAESAGGEMLTRPFRFAGSRLLLNYATAAAGSLRIEVRDAAGRPLPGFSLRESPELVGNRIDHPYAWPKGELARLAGKPVRLRVVMKDADLFSIRFA
jgi:hypothetical protein